RLPFEKSVFWPLGSRCGHCLQPIRLYDNIPLVSYWLLRGRCRTCKTAFSPRYFFVELLTGLGFAGLFYVEVICNVHGLRILDPEHNFAIAWGVVPAEGWVLFGYHALLLSFLIVTSFSDLEHLEIPLSVTVTGMVVGL